MNGDPFMESEDFQRAKQNRESQPVVYPDMGELTEESKGLVRSLSAQQRRRNVIPSLPNESSSLFMTQ